MMQHTSEHVYSFPVIPALIAAFAAVVLCASLSAAPMQAYAVTAAEKQAEADEALSKLNAMVDKGDNVLVTIITDGEENCSQEWSLQMVNKLIGKLKEQGWTFTLIGTDNLDVESMAHSMCIDEHLKFCEDAAGTNEMFLKERKARVRFNCCVAGNIAMKKGSFFSEE